MRKENKISGHFDRKLFMRVFLWGFAIFVIGIVSAGNILAEGEVFERGSIKVVECDMPTHRKQTPEQAAAGEPGDVFNASELSGYNAYITSNLSNPGNPTWLDDPSCNYEIPFPSLQAGQHYVFFETVDTEARVSDRSEVYPFELTDVPKIIMPPNPPTNLVVVGPGGPVATFGPVTIPTVYSSTAEIESAKFIVVNATVDSIGIMQGLFSRDESGQAESGHTTIYVMASGIVRARNQGLTESIMIDTVTPVQPGVPFTLALNIGPGGLQLYHDGVSVGHSPSYHPLSDNGLSLVVGGTCSVCTPADRTPVNPIDGSVFVELYSTEMVLLNGMGVS